MVNKITITKIDRNSDIKITDQLIFLIEDSIRRGELEPGSILPSERKLCEIYKVSRITVRQALEVLRNKGIIEKHHGIGNIVSFPKEKYPSKTRLIACLFFMSKTFTHYIVSGICQRLETTPFRSVVLDTTFNVYKERKALKELEKEVAGFLIIPCNSRLNLDIYTDLASRKFPVVFVDNYHPEIRISNVTTDNEKGGYMACQHLLSLGRRRLAFLSPLLNTAIRDRLKGFQRALTEVGLKPVLIKFSGMVPEPGVELIQKLRDQKILNKIDGIFAGNDGTAAQIIQELKKDGFRIPEDISIVGFDDLDFVKYLSPPLTTIRQPLFEIGYQAADLLCKKIEGNSEDYQEIRLQPELIVRESTCKLDLLEKFERR